MKKFLSMMAVAFAIGAVFLLLVARSQPAFDAPEVEQARVASQLHQIALADSTATFWAWFLPALALIFAAVSATAAATTIVLVATGTQHRRRLDELQIVAASSTLLPTPEGNYPARITAVGVIVPAPGNVIQPVPIHYEPHITYQRQVEPPLPLAASPALLDSPVAGDMPLLSATDVLDQLPFNRLLLSPGVDPATGLLITRELPKAVHILCAGSSGQGKSYLAQNFMLQLLARNDRNRLNLACLDIEGETSEPFTPYANISALEPAAIVEAMSHLRAELDRRYEPGGYDQDTPPATWLVFIEEALDLRTYLTKQQLATYVPDFQRIALRGRKRGIFLLAASQVEYSNLDFRAAQGQFLMRLIGACKPSAARAMGFTNTNLLNQLAKEQQPGQFLLEAPGGDRLIRTPVLDRHQLPELLRAARPAPISVNQSQSGDDPDLNRAIRAWQDGNQSVRKLQSVLGVTYHRAYQLYTLMRERGLIDG